MRTVLTILFAAMFIAIAAAGVLLAPAQSDAAQLTGKTQPRGY